MLNSHIISDSELTAIAKRCHEANRRHRRKIGETPGPTWEELPTAEPRQQESIKEGVKRTLDGSTPEQNHESWMAFKIADGWTYGETKDVAAKTHPQLVPYDQLPAEQREKDDVFQRNVKAGVAATLRDRAKLVDHRLQYRSPTEEQLGRYTEIRAAFRECGITVVNNTKPGAEQTVALRKLHDAQMQANIAIAIDES